MLSEMKSTMEKVVHHPTTLVFGYVCLAGLITFFVQLYLVTWNAPLHITLDNSFVVRSLNPKITASRRQIEINYNPRTRGFNVLNSGCQLPKLIPFGPSVAHLVGDPKQVVCRKSSPYLFTAPSTAQSSLKQVNYPEEFGFKDCCYKTVAEAHRPPSAELDDLVEDGCTPLSSGVNILPEKVEFVAVQCVPKSKNGTGREGMEPQRKVLDMFAFTPPNTRSMELNKTRFNKQKLDVAGKKLNVVILGLDSVSHMNFLRAMPLSYLYLTDKLSAYGMQGYSSVGSNTFYNLVPILTGLSVKELKKRCWRSNGDFFDTCPFIWKDFAGEGYATAFAEDATDVGIFTFGKRGFRKPPVDYYLHPFTTLQDRLIGHQRQASSNICYGPRPAFAVLLNYMKRLAVTMDSRSRPYFQLTWATALFHDYLNHASLGDGHLLQTLEWFQRKHYLQNTILILMSDHGMRFGKIRSFDQGKTEERMPFLYFVLPKEFRDKYPEAVKNYYENRHKLTTPYDLHETLKDLLHPHKLATGRIMARTANLKTTSALPRGLSLFLPIPRRRTCADAHIDLHWCVCYPKILISITDPVVTAAAKIMVEHVNNILMAEQNCATLSIDHIIRAEHRINVSKSDLNQQIRNVKYTHQKDILDVGITLVTTPGNARLEGTLVLTGDGTNAWLWKVSGAVSRIDAYKLQGNCIQDSFLKQYCFCIPSDPIIEPAELFVEPNPVHNSSQLETSTLKALNIQTNSNVSATE